ncbi:hypothetical protein BX600DRAFT_532434 [Xylariales sp. PMI_506]|nr:hypothetical protein BX600DRAFT_532434 [Xylariales sp. PMI_506]
MSRDSHCQGTVWQAMSLGDSNCVYMLNCDGVNKELLCTLSYRFSCMGEAAWDDAYAEYSSPSSVICLIGLLTIYTHMPLTTCARENMRADRADRESIEDYFLTNHHLEWQPCTNTRIVVPVRLKDGSVQAMCLKENSQDHWKIFLNTLYPEKRTASGKPSRHVNFTLTEKLIIYPLTTQIKLITGRFDDFDLFFKREIDLINKKNTTGNWELQLATEWPGDNPNYMPVSNSTMFLSTTISDSQMPELTPRKMSKNPFDLYETWIHKNDWSNYMRGFGQSEMNPIRTFPKEASREMDELMMKIGNQENKPIETPNEPPESKTRQGSNVNSSNKPYSGDSISGNKNAAEHNTPQRNLVQNGWRNYEKDGCYTYALIDFNANTIVDFRGRVKGQEAQEGAIGGVSASDIAISLGWRQGNDQGQTNLIAEKVAYTLQWLHLSPFSWDELQKSGTEGEVSRTQSFENIVLSTPETSSLMARYEMAWQEFIVTEASLRSAKKQGSDSFADGELEINLNDRSSAIEYDKEDSAANPKTYSIESLLKLDTVEYDKWLGLPTDLNTEKNQNENDLSQKLQQTENRIPTLRQLLRLAQQFPFIAYTIKYSPRITSSSHIFGTETFGNTFYFYPFQRPMYHSAEAKLDGQLWEKLKRAAVEKSFCSFGEDDRIMGGVVTKNSDFYRIMPGMSAGSLELKQKESSAIQSHQDEGPYTKKIKV